jgi:hypothetical protein
MPVENETKGFVRPEARALEQALARRGRVLLRGARGTGKSHLLRGLLDASPGARLIDRESLERGTPDASSAGVLLVDEAREQDAALLQGRRCVIATSRARGPNWSSGMEEICLFPLDYDAWSALMGTVSLERYLSHGGLFEADPGRIQERLLLAITRDVLLQREIRDPSVLIDIAVDILSQPGRPVSATRFKGVRTRSVDQARMFLAHLDAAGIVKLVPRLEDLGRKAAQASRLGFAPDTSVPISLGAERGEGVWLNALLVELERSGAKPAAWRIGERWGLAGLRAGHLAVLVDVQQEGAPSPAWLEKAMLRYGCGASLLLHAGPASDPGVAVRRDGLSALSFQRWLLHPAWPWDTEQTDISENKPKSRRASHLL